MVRDAGRPFQKWEMLEKKAQRGERRHVLRGDRQFCLAGVQGSLGK